MNDLDTATDLPASPPPTERPAVTRLRFGNCTIDTRRRELRVGDQLVPLQPRVYELLQFLAGRPGQVIAKPELLLSVWRTPHVTDAVLATAMLKLRRAIGDTGRSKPVLATVRGVGYRFDAEVRAETGDAPATAAPGDAAPRPDAAAVGPRALLQSLIEGKRAQQPLAAPPQPSGQADQTAAAARSIDAAASVAPGAAFWQTQLQRAIDLERRSLSEQSLTLLQSCLPHLPASTEIVLLHARLLRQRMALAQADQVLQQALDQAQGDGQARSLLLTELAALRQLQGDAPGALLACDQAVALIAEGVAPVAGLPAVLVMASQLDFAAGEYRHAAHKALRASSFAQSLDDKATEVVASISLARAAYMDGEVQRANDTLRRAVRVAHAEGLTSLEADAYMRLAFQENVRWHHAAAVDYAQRASALCSASGDLVNWHRAQVREMLCLIDLGRLADAQALFDRHFQESAAWESPVTRDNQLMVRRTLDWRCGRADAAVAQLRDALAAVPATAVDRRRRLSYRLMISLLCLGRQQEADQVRQAHAWLGYLTRQVHLEAAFALQAGERGLAKRLLRTAWLTEPSDGTEAWHVLESLAWLLLEDGETGGLAVLMPDLARLSREQASIPLVLWLHELRRGACAWDARHWAALVRANAGLVNRHAWLLDDAACQAWLHGSGTKLPVLLPDACF